LSWISRSIADADLDIKAVLLCSALESLLAQKKDRDKAILIMIRFLTLHLEMEKSYSDPIDILNGYRVRSAIVHGSVKNIVTEQRYKNLSWLTKLVVGLYVDYGERVHATDPVNLLNKLDSSSHSVSAKKWLLDRYPKLEEDFRKYFSPRETSPK